MSLLETFKLAQSQVYFAKINPNLKAAKELILPMLRNPLGQMVISIVVGYYATTAIQKLLGMRKKDEETTTAALPLDPSTYEHRQLPDSRNALFLNTRQLAAFNGSPSNDCNSDHPIYTALNGKIYDLSSCRSEDIDDFQLLAGCDANKVLKIACNAMGVSSDDMIQRWEQRLNAEFDIVGYLLLSEDDDDDDSNSYSNSDKEDDVSTVVDCQLEKEKDEL